MKLAVRQGGYGDTGQDRTVNLAIARMPSSLVQELTAASAAAEREWQTQEERERERKRQEVYVEPQSSALQQRAADGERGTRNGKCNIIYVRTYVCMYAGNGRAPHPGYVSCCP